MAAGREALATMLVVRANAARKAARVAAQEEAAHAAAHAAEKRTTVAAQEEAARAAAWAKELVEEAAADAAAREEMVRDHRRWDKDMAADRRVREIHELASECHHHRNLARARHAHQTDDEGSNVVDAGWGDALV
jgi:hypothetical protein